MLAFQTTIFLRNRNYKNLKILRIFQFTLIVYPQKI